VEIEQTSQIEPSPSLLTGLSMVGGLGITIVVVALGFGAAGVFGTDSSAVNGGVLLGLLLLAVGIGGWVIAVQPFRKFDDINQPLDDGHHGHAHHEDAHDDHTAAAHH
jgi:hypothetical protein